MFVFIHLIFIYLLFICLIGCLVKNVDQTVDYVLVSWYLHKPYVVMKQTWMIPAAFGKTGTCNYFWEVWLQCR